MINKESSSHIDYVLLLTIGMLLLTGILILADVSAVLSQEKFGKPTYYLLHQLFYGIIPGLIIGFIAYKINLFFIKKYSWIFVFFTLVIMSFVFLPKMGVTSGGATRWLNFGFFTFQPSEILKLTFIIYLSTWLSKRIEITKKTKSSKKYKKPKTWVKVFIPFLAIMGVIIILLTLQRNLSTLMVILITGGLIYFSASTPLIQIIIIFLIILLVALLLIKFFPYRLNRVMLLLDPLKDPMGLGYQLKQSLIAVGSGGILGLGLGNSYQKFGYVPQVISDSIFAIFAEETGFIGASLLVFLFLFFLWRCLYLAKKTNDLFSRFYIVGFSSWICIQAFINIGAMIGIVPLTGIPLPFIGYGGSHILVELIGAGILLNISKSIKN
ncbi:MAG TPA: FtsW/RodA/SpoVE family cell cycle protein [Candidatus Pacearchaeota archaeon]|nr:FtsW/RodA/SpoVE family cell cycle protein [Candidatus Paceibacterota bacterium]HPO68442.1 FtsW/RodA/SpoVE family cell cycle protein [Candidatus Pacearchaeota archaeon]